MLSAVITTVVGALLISAILAAVKSRWLYVVAPKLYLNTPISDGQIISIEIFNAGLTSEEDVAVTFRKACKFELIGTSKSTLAVVGKTLSISKLSKLESVTVVLLIEGKAFDAVDIESIESKATKGKVVESKERATALWQSFVMLPILLLFLIVPFAFGNYIGAEDKTSIFAYLNAKMELIGERKQLSGYKTTITERSSDAFFVNALEQSKVEIETTEVVRRGDVLRITTRVTNRMDEALMFEGYLKTSAGEGGPLSFWDSRFETFALGPGESRLVEQRAYLPETLSTKVVDNRISIENLADDTMQVSQRMQFD
jgi:hypothetical protein